MEANQGGLIFGLCSQLLSLQMTLQMTGSPQLKGQYLPGMISGELIGAHAVTERGAGSDAFSIQTVARREGECFRLSGSKAYVTASPDADLALVFARTSEEPGPFCLTAFLVDLRWEGVSRGEVFHKSGLKGIEMGELHFDGVPVPIDHVVGAEGGGVGILAESTGWERALLPATLLGPMRRSIDGCTEWARKRETVRASDRCLPTGFCQNCQHGDAAPDLSADRLRHGRSPSAVHNGASPDATGRHRQAIRHRKRHSGSTGRPAGHGSSRLPGGVPRPAGSEGLIGRHSLVRNLGDPAQHNRPLRRPAYHQLLRARRRPNEV